MESQAVPVRTTTAALLASRIMLKSCPLKGDCPLTRLNRITPRLNISPFSVYAMFLKTSGAMYPGVPERLVS